MGKDIYRDGEYVKHNPQYHIEDSAWKAQQILRMINAHNLRPATVCEVGCGAGEVLRNLQLSMPDDTNFIGYDISPQAVELCKDRANEKLAFHCGDLLSMDTPFFDLLLCIDVFEHVEDYMGFLRKLRQRAKYKLFHIPMDLSVQAILRRHPILDGRRGSGHLHYFMKETALLTLQDTGYEVLDCFHTRTTIDKVEGVKSRLLRLLERLISLFNADLAVRVVGKHGLLVLTT
jgi:2-polyprenyl-3-methyl-5-hydroxy-6-metoxy-1,4-benzoquinol methylase